MATREGTQDIPSNLLDLYRANLNSSHPEAVVKKRYPFQMRRMREGGTGVRPAQKTQRARFKTAKEKFRTVDTATRARWYAAEPPYSSFLWYYNYFIMSSLNGNANIDGGGAGVIKSIQSVPMTIGAGTAEGTATITTIDSSKAVVMLYGASVAEGQVGDYPYASPVYPYISDFTDTEVKAKWSQSAPFGDNTKEATISVIVIEYI